jgi:hypothetical protein
MFLVMIRHRRRPVDLGHGLFYVSPPRWQIWNAWETEAQALDEAYHLRGVGCTARVIAGESYSEFCTQHRVR